MLEVVLLGVEVTVLVLELLELLVPDREVSLRSGRPRLNAGSDEYVDDELVAELLGLNKKIGCGISGNCIAGGRIFS